jgi:predicted dehydrogenase
MNIAVIGTGYVADFYGKTLENYPELKLVGAYDNNKENLESFSRRWRAAQYLSLEQALNDPSVEMVLNLTNPRSHYKVTKLSLEAGKHVYSEKPLAMDTETAGELAALAKNRNVYLATAPYGRRFTRESSAACAWSMPTSRKA